MDNLIAIERQQGVTIYGQVLDHKGKLGKFQVYSAYTKSEEYATYAEAESRMHHIIGVKNN